jgi:hypothetical protein
MVKRKSVALLFCHTSYMLKTVSTFTHRSFVELSHYAHRFAAISNCVARLNMVTLIRPNIS